MLVRDALSTSDIDSLDAELLLSAVLCKPRTWLIAHAEESIAQEDLMEYEKFAQRYRGGEPMAYILGTQEFYGRAFTVDPCVLIPRTATERLIELSLKALAGDSIPEVTSIDTQIVAWHHRKEAWNDVRLITDIGTGSGCIAITLACERPDVRIIATDISEEALNIARKNTENHSVGARIDFRMGSCLAPLHEIDEPYVLISNPPYIPAGTPLESTVQDFEPHTALFSGTKGTDVLTKIITSAIADPHCKGWMIECREEQVTPTAVSS